MQSSKNKVAELLSYANIEINGSKPYDIAVYNDAIYDRVITKGSLGLGEAYMDGWWDCERLDEFFYQVLKAHLETKVRSVFSVIDLFRSVIFNSQSPSRAFQIGKKHYDTGNELFSRMLDKLMIYSCGYWKNAENLDEAQEAKLDLICQKLKLEPGMRVLDIGCGWGGAAKYAAEKYGVQVTGITVSKEQAGLANEMCEGLPVNIMLTDYRDLNEKFDRIFSIGMFEHVGYKNYNTYFNVVRRCLKEDGLFLLHTIGSNVTDKISDPWISRYIFPNSSLPSAKEITAAVENKFVIEDWHNFSSYYDKTLMVWYDNFVSSWNDLKGKYDDRFFNMWKYYLMCSAGSFRARKNQLWQIVLSPKGVTGGYKSVR